MSTLSWVVVLIGVVGVVLVVGVAMYPNMGGKKPLIPDSKHRLQKAVICEYIIFHGCLYCGAKMSPSMFTRACVYTIGCPKCGAKYEVQINTVSIVVVAAGKTQTLDPYKRWLYYEENRLREIAAEIRTSRKRWVQEDNIQSRDSP